MCLASKQLLYAIEIIGVAYFIFAYFDIDSTIVNCDFHYSSPLHLYRDISEPMSRTSVHNNYCHCHFPLNWKSKNHTCIQYIIQVLFLHGTMATGKQAGRQAGRQACTDKFIIFMHKFQLNLNKNNKKWMRRRFKRRNEQVQWRRDKIQVFTQASVIQWTWAKSDGRVKEKITNGQDHCAYIVPLGGSWTGCSSVALHK